MKYNQTSEILFSTTSVATKDLVMNAQWPSHLAITFVRDAIESLSRDRDASDFNCLILNDDAEMASDIRMMGVTTPIICLIRGSNASARIESLQAGADDCLGPVFAVSELVMRVESLCRRSNGHDLRGRVRENSVSLSIKTQTASMNGRSVSLTQTEALILRLFLENQDRLLSADQISSHVWGEEGGATNNLVCVHIANLRRKMNTLPWLHPIRTIRGRGYILKPE